MCNALPAGTGKGKPHTLEDGSATHSFQQLMGLLQIVGGNTWRTKNAVADVLRFKISTTREAKQKSVLELIERIWV